MLEKDAVNDHDVNFQLSKAWELIAHSDFEAAISVLNEVLLLDSNQALAKFMLADILSKIGAREDALQCVESAIQSDSQCIVYWDFYIKLVESFNHSASTKEAFVLAKQNFLSDLDSTVGNVDVENLYQLGRYDELDRLVSCHIAANFDDGVAWRYLGISLCEQGCFVLSHYAMENALMLLPNDSIAHFNFATLLSKQNLLESAETHFRKAIKLNPHLIAAYNNLGNCLRKLGRLNEAESCLRMMIKFDTKSYIARVNLVGILEEKGDYDKAYLEAKKALEIAPDSAEVLNALGAILNVQGRDEQALVHLRKAIQLRPNFADAFNNIGTIYFSSKKYEEAKPYFLKAIELNPHLGGPHRCMGQISQTLDLDQDAAERYFRAAIDLNPKDYEAHTSLLFLLSERGQISNDALFNEHRRFGDIVEREFRSTWGAFRNSKDPNRKIRVGFVSGDLNNHAVASFVAPIFNALHQSPELYLVAYDNNKITDFVTQELKTCFDRWHKVDMMSDSELFALIQKDGIDILCDLAGHTSKNRLTVMARKPAPVQLSWIGYPGTTGLYSIDYYIADRFYLPKGEFDKWFTEKLAYLPCTSTFQPSDLAPDVSPLPTLGSDVFTFGSFNRLSKISDDTIKIWAALLRAIPKSRLIIGAMPENKDLSALESAFSRLGVEGERLIFQARCSLKEYLEKYKDIDLCIDTFPFNGGTTTHQGLWMGVPTLSIKGKRIAARSSAAILGQAGLEEFLADDANDFVAKGILWSERKQELASIRSSLRQQCENSIKSHPDLLAAYFNKALRYMWCHWCSGKQAESFDVEAV